MTRSSSSAPRKRVRCKAWATVNPRTGQMSAVHLWAEPTFIFGDDIKVLVSITEIVPRKRARKGGK